MLITYSTICYFVLFFHNFFLQKLSSENAIYGLGINFYNCCANGNFLF